MAFAINLQSKRINLSFVILSALGAGWYFSQSETLDVDDPSHGLFPLTVGKTWV
jgi:hypothetical protein